MTAGVTPCPQNLLPFVIPHTVTGEYRPSKFNRYLDIHEMGASEHTRYAAIIAAVATAAAPLMVFVFFQVQNLVVNTGDPIGGLEVHS